MPLSEVTEDICENVNVFHGTTHKERLRYKLQLTNLRCGRGQDHPSTTCYRLEIGDVGSREHIAHLTYCILQADSLYDDFLTRRVMFVGSLYKRVFACGLLRHQMSPMSLTILTLRILEMVGSGGLSPPLKSFYSLRYAGLLSTFYALLLASSTCIITHTTPTNIGKRCVTIMLDLKRI